MHEYIYSHFKLDLNVKNLEYCKIFDFKIRAFKYISLKHEQYGIEKNSKIIS